MALLQKAYLGATPLFRNTAWFEDDAVSLVSQGSATVTASASTNTKGSYTEIIASTAANASALLIAVDGVSINNTNTAALIDVAFGASGSESVKIADVAVGGARNSGATEAGSIQFIVPLQIPSGTRIAARIQGAIASETANVFIRALDAGDYSTAPTAVDSVGGNTADSTGIALSGASGTWVELIASTSQAYRALVIVPSLAATSTIGTQQTTFDIGTGASGAEVAFGFISARYGSDESVSNALLAIDPVLPKAIASGTRISIKHYIASNPQVYQFTVIGIP